MNSPGHSAQYCSHTLMEMGTKKILCIVTMDKRVTDRKNTNLEKVCFEKGMQTLKDNGLKIVEVVTDAHLQIGALMSKLIPATYSSTSFVNLRIGSALELIGYS